MLITIMAISCQAPGILSEDGQERNKEAREDSAKYAHTVQERKKITEIVSPVAETDPVDAGTADDPAIWYNANEPENSIVFGTNKKGGIYAYNLKGEELDYYPLGEINNIDIRQDIPLLYCELVQE